MFFLNKSSELSKLTLKSCKVKIANVLFIRMI